jgi:serine/threonine protein kinase/tetratricopeptide (TPR) repeat protein
MSDLSGQVINGYEILERVGTGGFGVVYRAYQPSVGREVAIKIILPQYARQPDFLLRFETEARLIARLEHPFIVPLFDFWHEPDGSAYIVMRWLRGGSLQYLLRSGPLPLETIARLLDQISQALDMAHQAGVVHRDLKPANILLDDRDNAYLSDFGIAKDLSSSAHITTPGHTPGTPAYAAPEQVTGQPVTRQTDIYSLGLTLYECLTGSHPFPDAPLQHLHRSLPPVQLRRPDVPVKVNGVLRRATAKVPARRYADVLSFARELQRALSSAESVVPVGETHGDTAQVSPPSVTGASTISLTPREDAVVQDRRTTFRLYTPPPCEQSATLIETANDVTVRPRKLIGRDGLRAEIHALLDQNERLLLHGLAGMGKTSLAAQTVIDRIGQGRGPVLWLRVGSGDTLAVYEALMHPFNGHLLGAGQSSTALAQTVREVLVDRQIKLLVLDDVWNPEALRHVSDALPPDVPLLATSRQRYPVGPILDVGELEPAEALALLGHHAHRAYAADDVEAMELCQRLGYHAFTLEIAGETLQVDALSPAELLQRIADAPHLMVMPEGFAEEGRLSFKDLLDVSVNALDADTREVFLALGAFFAPTATPELLALCMGRDSQVVEKALILLGRRGLVNRLKSPGGTIPRYHMHDLAHSYARAATHLSRQVVIEACEAYVTHHLHDLDALDAERINLLKAAEAAHRTGQNESLIAIMRALTVDGPYLAARGHDPLLVQQLDRAIEAVRPMGADQAETLHFLLGKRGNAHYDRGNLPAALDTYREALDLARDLHLLHRQVILLCVISTVRADQEDFAGAEADLEEASQIAHTVGDNLLITRVLEQQGYYYAKAKHDFEAAAGVYARQVTLAEQLGEPERLFFALQNLGAARLDSGQLSEALSELGKALDLARGQDNHLWVAHTLYPMGVVHHQMSDQVSARQCFEQAMELYRATGHTAKIEAIIDYMAQAGYPVDKYKHEDS